MLNEMNHVDSTDVQSGQMRASEDLEVVFVMEMPQDLNKRDEFTLVRLLGYGEDKYTFETTSICRSRVIERYPFVLPYTDIDWSKEERAE